MLLDSLRRYGTITILVVTAAARLAFYRGAARVRGRSPHQAVGIMQRWNRRAWRRLRLTVDVDGVPSGVPCVYVANHRTYLDICVLNGVLGATFLSRADVAKWPLFGAIAKEVGTVFVERDDPAGRGRAARTLLRRAREASIIVFPEGTTCSGRLPGPFQTGLFRLLHRLDVPIVPVTIRYSDRRAYWVDDISLWTHLQTRVLASPSLRCSVHIGTPMPPTDHADDAVWRAAVHAAISAVIEARGELCS
jgi:1-acyl-sn-glycerol-3-phosphate acyltransferase